MMSQFNKDLIKQKVNEAAEMLKQKLQPTLSHPVRNPWAHVWQNIKLKMGKSYSDCNDANVTKIIQIIEGCQNK